MKDYNPNDPRMALKISHIERVSQKAKLISENLKLEEEDIKLAELIGILHDIGRFEQIKRYNTFMDKDSVNHAEYGVKVLFEDGLIRKFIEDDKYDKFTLNKIKEEKVLLNLYNRFNDLNDESKEKLNKVYTHANNYLNKEIGI